MLGLQGVVEHLGELLLESLGAYQHPAGVALHALRQKVLAQEQGHVALGMQCLRTLNHRRDHTGALARYQALGRASACQVAELLDDARLDADAFWSRVDARLDHWHTQALRP